MSFSNMLEILQKKNKDKIVLIKAGIFYIAVGKDAVFLNEQLNLKCICFKEGICKIGIPESRLEYYLRKLERLNLAYVVYQFDHQKEELIQKYENHGKGHKEDRENKNCLICKGIKKYGEDKYLIALQELLEKENEIDE